MPDSRSRVDGARVLADLNALRGIGAYKTGVHKPTFSEPHMRSLEWLAEKLPEAGLTATIDGIGNVLGTSAKSGAKLLAGSHLESQNYAGWLDGPIGVVTSIVGIWQYQISFTGEQNHAGTTRMGVRKDAGVALARFCVAIDDRFPGLCGPGTVWTTGRITLDPGAPSIIPGRAEMLFQIRDDDPGVIDRLEGLLQSMAAEVTAQGRCSVELERLRTGAPAMMDGVFQQTIEAASASLAGGKSIRMPSGAGHDAQILATIMPAGMLFVPSIGGISHHWSENTDDADIVTGAQVFVETCRRLLAGNPPPAR